MIRAHVLICGGTGCTSSHSAEIIAEYLFGKPRYSKGVCREY